MNRLLQRLRKARVLQVLGVYIAGSFGVLQGVDIFINRFDLPDWFFPGSVILLIVGLPIVLATALLQSRGSNSPGGAAQPSSAEDYNLLIQSNDATRTEHQHFLTWRRALLGGVGAFLIL